VTHPAEWDRHKAFEEKLNKLGFNRETKNLVGVMAIVAVASIVIEAVMEK